MYDKVTDCKLLLLDENDIRVCFQNAPTNKTVVKLELVECHLIFICQEFLKFSSTEFVFNFTMSLIFRLARPGYGNQFLKNTNGMISWMRPVTLKATSITPPKEEGHDERNMKLGRPQSPHLTIYAPQLTSLLSITHRATGMALAFYTIAFGLTAAAAPESISEYIDAVECMELGKPVLSGLKFMLAFPMTYHFWNGIRHLLWDSGRFLTIREVYATGYIMLILAIATAVGLSVM
ncbi:succinate dehydrogenase cytochrome b560 subunit, mitochondrial-like [Diorhabda sublineata]|uniref:succinate dehydrogenase cytochrome b560 subunit, mitochondrial-like n=1 Tax=Diorhabda sublineata TaxID=1163346 RepID=UPI0024E0B801|nr:succinate dehydrogenase cytochrome b560 subunit, mitochondrial-like [Diorhabda sublineata]